MPYNGPLTHNAGTGVFIRALVFLAFLMLLTGCTSTRTLESAWNESTVADINGHVERGVQLETTQGPVKGQAIRAGLLKVELGWRAWGAGIDIPYDSLRWQSYHASDIRAITFSRRDRGQGALYAGLAGAVAGGLFGSAARNEDNELDRPSLIIGSALFVGGISALVGAVVGAPIRTRYLFSTRSR